MANASSRTRKTGPDHRADSNGSHANLAERKADPFVYTFRPTELERLRLYLMLVFVFPLRALCFVVFVGLAWILAFIAVYGRPDDSQEPMKPWRRMLKVPVIVLVRIAFFACGIHWVTIKGVRVSSEEAPILCMAPHSAFVDVLVGFVCGLPVTVSRMENAHIPVIGTLFRLTEAIFVSRNEAQSRQWAMHEIRRRAATKGGWPQVMVFPESICTNRTCLIPFKTGAFAPGVPVQPLCIRYPNQHDWVTWMSAGPSLISIVILMMCMPSTRMEVEFLPVYYPSEAECADANLFASNVQSLMARHLGLPIVEHGYEYLQERIATTKPERSLFHFFKQLWRLGFVEMPSSHKSEKDC